MAQRLVLNRVYPVSREALWELLEMVLTEVAGVTLIRTEADRKRATLQTGVTWTSWGQNMVATVEAMTPATARLTITGQVRHTFLSSGWGEALHAKGVARRLDRALGQVTRPGLARWAGRRADSLQEKSYPA